MSSAPSKPRSRSKVSSSLSEGNSEIGEVVEVTVDRAYKHSLAGSPTADALSRLRAVPPRKAPEKRRRLLPLAPEGH